MNPNTLRLACESLGILDSGKGEHVFYPLRSEWVMYLLRFMDGSHERYQIAYTGGIEAQALDRGWRCRARCLRQMGMLNQAGERFEKIDGEGLAALAETASENGQGAWDCWRQSPEQAAAAAHSRAFREAMQALTHGFGWVVMRDKMAMESHFRRTFKGLEALSEVA